MSMIELKNLEKIFSDGFYDIHVLKQVNLKIDKGELVAIIGPSGSGKSTLLNILGFMDSPSTGEYYLNDVDTSTYNDRQYSKLRGNIVSFIFQDYNLLDDYNVYENVELPLLHKRIRNKEKKSLIGNTLVKLGIENRVNLKTSKLSGGERQRVAIARSLVTGCEVLLADEPTGALDQKRGQEILQILKDLNEKEGKTVIIVTHDMNIAKQCKRIIKIVDGVVSEEAI